MGTVSIIIPVYNVTGYIDRCIQSLIAQTYTDLEILLIDDGSTDNSLEICQKYADKDNRVKVFHKENGGVSSARNLGIENATGEYISFVDPDDWVELNMYETIIAHFRKKDIDAVFCGYIEDYASQNKTNILHCPQKTGTVTGIEALHQCLIGMGYGYFTSVWNKIFRRHAILESGITFEKYSIGEDELWLTKFLPNIKNVHLISDQLYHWDQRQGSALRGKRDYEKWYSALSSKKAVMKAVEDYPYLYSLSKAKAYNDIFDIVWKAYVEGDKDTAIDFLNKLNPYKKDFYMNTDFSIKKRIKYFLLKYAVIFNLSKSVVYKIGSATAYRVSEKFTKGHNTNE